MKKIVISKIVRSDMVKLGIAQMRLQGTADGRRIIRLIGEPRITDTVMSPSQKRIEWEAEVE